MRHPNDIRSWQQLYVIFPSLFLPEDNTLRGHEAQGNIFSALIRQAMHLGKYLPHGFLLSGGLLVLWAGLHYCTAAIPFQDPSPEMEQQQQADMRASIHMLQTGAGAMGIGLVSMAVGWKRRKTEDLAKKGALKK